MSGLFKKLITLLIFLLILGCNESEKPSEKILIATTISPYKYLVDFIGKENVEVINSIPVGATPHHYEPTAKQVERLSQADFYFSVGGNMEFENTWVQKLRGVNNKLQVIDLSVGIEKIGNDPHIWLSPANVKIIAQGISNKLSEIIPEKKKQFNENLQILLDSLQKVQNEIEEDFTLIENKKLLVYHGSWNYFANEFGFEQIEIEEGSKSPTPQKIKSVLAEVQQNNIPVVFTDPQHGSSSAKLIANELNIELAIIDPLAENILENFIDVKNKIMMYYK